MALRVVSCKHGAEVPQHDFHADARCGHHQLDGLKQLHVDVGVAHVHLKGEPVGIAGFGQEAAARPLGVVAVAHQVCR